MAVKAGKKSRLAGFVALLFLSLQFLGSDFCQDVLSIPLKIDYRTAVMDIEVNFDPEDGASADGDLDVVVEDAEIPEGESEVELDPDGYIIIPQHQTVDFTDSASGGTAGLMDYKGNVVGVFIRLVNFEIVENTIPAEVNSMDVFLSPKVQIEEDDGSQDGDAESAESSESYTDPVTGVSYLDWDAALADEAYKNWDLPSVGEGEHGLVKLGITEPILCMQPGEGSDGDESLPYCAVPAEFPSPDKRIIREIGNLDALSGIITENFKFEVVIIPQDRIYIDDETWSSVDKSKDWQLKIKMHFIVVISAKVD